MAKIIVDMSGRKGLSNYTSLTNNAYFIEDGELVQSGSDMWNPFVRDGHLSPSFSSATNVTFDTTLTDAVKCFVYDAVQDDYYVSAKHQIYKGDSLLDTSLANVYVGNASDNILDLELYQVNGVRKLFFVYKTAAGKADIGISSLPYDSATDNPTWLTGTVTGAFTNDLNNDAWIQNSDNGFAYFLMANQVYKIDGTLSGGANGTISSALLFPVDTTVVDSLDYNGKLFIALHKYSFNTRLSNLNYYPTGAVESGIYIWNKATTTASSSDYIPLPSVSIIHKIFLGGNGKISLIATNVSSVTSLYEFDGSSFVVVKTLSIAAYPVLRDGLSKFHNGVVFYAKNGYVYYIGKPNQYSDYGVFQIYNTDENSYPDGIIFQAKVSDSSALFIGYYSSVPSYKNIIVSMPINYSELLTSFETQNYSSLYYKTIFLPHLSTVNHVLVYGMKCLTSGSTQIGQVIVSINSDAFIKTFLVTKDLWSRGYIDIPVEKPFVDSITLRVVYPGNVNVGRNEDFSPAYAEIDYTPTKTNR